jgi:hypothetical protein
MGSGLSIRLSSGLGDTDRKTEDQRSDLMATHQRFRAIFCAGASKACESIGPATTTVPQQFRLRPVKWD